MWGQGLWSDPVWRVSKVTGLCIPMLEWRRFGLYQHSIHSKIALASSSRVCHVLGVEQLELHGPPERFHHRIVVAVADGAHRAEQPGVAEPLPERPRRVLRAVIGMQDRRLPPVASGLPADDRHAERVDDQLGAHVLGDRPADDQPGVGVHDRRAVHLALRRRVLGDVGEPQPVRRVDRELAVDQVVARSGGRVAHGAAAAPCAGRGPGCRPRASAGRPACGSPAGPAQRAARRAPAASRRCRATRRGSP